MRLRAFLVELAIVVILALTEVTFVVILFSTVFLSGPERSIGKDQAPDPAPSPASTAVVVRVDPRIELVCIVFRLAGHPEYSQARVKSYTDDVEERFGPLRDHDVVEQARALRSSRGISYDACMSLAVHLTDDGTLAERIPFDPRPESLDPRWTPAAARSFARALKGFAEQSRFNEFFEAHRPLYDTIEGRMRSLIDREGHLDWFPSFFGPRPDSQFRVALAMLNGSSNYGPRVRLADGAEEYHAILGAWTIDREGYPTYGQSSIETLAHELTHSYANPIIDRHEPELREDGPSLFQPVAQVMRRQAYGQWQTMLRETLVRACTLRYVRAHQGRIAAWRFDLQQRSRGFELVSPLATLLDDYEANRDRYPTLDDFGPRLVGFFHDQARSRRSAEPRDAP